MDSVHQRLFGLVASFVLVVILGVSPSRAGTYIAVDLYTLQGLTGPNDFAVENQMPGNAFGGQVAGYDGAAGLLWNGTGTPVNLDPTGMPAITYTYAFATNGQQQVGDGSAGVVNAPIHAVMWNSTPASAVDLNPPGYASSVAWGTSGSQQVGSASLTNSQHNRAMLWYGSATTAVDLHPSQFTNSVAYGTDGTHQVGDITTFDSTSPNLTTTLAVMWSGTAASVEMLGGGFEISLVWGISPDDSQEVGSARYSLRGAPSHAVLWSGPNVATDLGPADLPVNGASTALASNGRQQVGFVFEGTGNLFHAYLWSGTAASAVDLQNYLSPNFQSSYAAGIDAAGNVFGTAIDDSGETHAIEWIPVPEPTILTPLLVGLLLWRRRADRDNHRVGTFAAWILLFGMFACPCPAGTGYNGIRLYTLQGLNGTGSFTGSGTAAGGQVVGQSGTPASPGDALLWDGSGIPIDLSPTNLSGFTQTSAFFTNGQQQVGVGAIGTTAHALLWSGTGAAAVDLNPSGYDNSTALSTNGTQQVGQGNPHGVLFSQALLWNGSASTFVNLQPAGFPGSTAQATNGVNQVGVADTSTGTLAMIWTGTANSARLLGGGFDNSSAGGISPDGTQIVGYGSVGTQRAHAVLWQSASGPVIDLTPVNFPTFVASFATASNGQQQVGYALDNVSPYHAIVWSGTGASAVDLETFLPANLVSSEAWSIDSSGDIFGTAMDTSGDIHAVEWIPVPEPTILMPLALLAVVRRKHPKCRKLRASGVEVFIIRPGNLSASSTRIITEFEAVPFPGQDVGEFNKVMEKLRAAATPVKGADLVRAGAVLMRN